MSTKQLREDVAAIAEAKHPLRTLHKRQSQELHDLRMAQLLEKEMMKREQASQREAFLSQQSGERLILRSGHLDAKQELIDHHRSERNAR